MPFTPRPSSGTNLASPPPIGNTTPNTIAFTTATGDGGGITNLTSANLVGPLPALSGADLTDVIHASDIGTTVLAPNGNASALTNIPNPFDQSLNTASNPSFSSVNGVSFNGSTTNQFIISHGVGQLAIIGGVGLAGATINGVVLGTAAGSNTGDFQTADADLSSWALVTRASGFDTFTVTPSSANLRSLLTDETGTGAAVFATSPTLVTPDLGTPSAMVATNVTALNATNISAGTLADGRNTVSNSTTTTLSALVTIGGLTTVTGTGAMSFTGGAGNMTLTSGTGNSRTLTLRTTTSGGTATNAIVIGADQTVTISSSTTTGGTATTGALVVTGGVAAGGDSTFAGKTYVGSNRDAYYDNAGQVWTYNGAAFQRRCSWLNNANNCLQLGGISSSFAGIQQSGTTVTIGLADNTAGGALVASGTLAVTLTLAVTGATTFTGAVTCAATLRLGNYIVSGLPAAATAGVGATAFVTDGSTTLILGLGLTVAGSGSNKVPVYSDGTNWIVG